MSVSKPGLCYFRVAMERFVSVTTETVATRKSGEATKALDVIL